MSMTVSRSQPQSEWLTQIFNDLGATIFGYLKTMLGDTAAAEDVLQNVFVRLMAVTPSEIHNLRSFVFTLAHNEAVREAERRQRDNEAVTRSDKIFTVADRQTLSAVEVASLEEALVSLPAEQRQVVYLKIYGDLSFDEIAQTLAIPNNTAASRYRYALQKMRDFLGERP